jgi:hypothetical protein
MSFDMSSLTALDGLRDNHYYQTNLYGLRQNSKLPPKLSSSPPMRLWVGFGGAWIAHLYWKDCWEWDLKGYYQPFEKVLQDKLKANSSDRHLVLVGFNTMPWPIPLLHRIFSAEKPDAD